MKTRQRKRNVQVGGDQRARATECRVASSTEKNMNEKSGETGTQSMA